MGHPRISSINTYWQRARLAKTREIDRRVSLSIVITVVGGELALCRCLGSLSSQISDRGIEVIVPFDSTIQEIGGLAKDYPWVCFLQLGTIETAARPGTPEAAHEIYDIRKARGLAEGHGRILALLDDCGYPAPDWVDQVLGAHLHYPGVIGGAIEQVGSGLLNWAVYFPDFSRYQLPLKEGPVHSLSDINVSYKSEDLNCVREAWECGFNDAVVHPALSERGIQLWQIPQLIVYLDRGELSLHNLFLERYAWGKLYGSKRAICSSQSRRLICILASPLIPVLLISRIFRKVVEDRRNRKHFFYALPHIIALTCVWCIGELIGTIMPGNS